MKQRTHEHRLEVLEIIQQNNKLTYDEVAALIGDLSGEQVRRIVHKAEKDGVVVENRAVLDPRKLGLGLLYFVTIVLKDKRSTARDEVIDRISSYANVQEIHRISGEKDIHVKLRCETTDGKAIFDDFLRSIDNISEFSDLMVSVTCLETSVINVTKPVANSR